MDKLAIVRLRLVTASPNLILGCHPPIDGAVYLPKPRPTGRQIVFSHGFKIEKRTVGTDESSKYGTTLLF